MRKISGLCNLSDNKILLHPANNIYLQSSVFTSRWCWSNKCGLLNCMMFAYRVFFLLAKNNRTFFGTTLKQNTMNCIINATCNYLEKHRTETHLLVINHQHQLNVLGF